MEGRWLARPLAAALRRPYVHILFGARQTGKSTLLRSLLPSPALRIDLSEPGQRAAYLARPRTLVEECRALPRARRPHVVVVDEAQSVPALFDAVQHLYDTERARYRFVLCGSSARKLRRTGANLLPGRAVLHHLHALTLSERPSDVEEEGATAGVSPLPLAGEVAGGPLFPRASLLERLTFGELPGIALAPRGDRAAVLRAYAYVYLEEELRREALIKDWAPFARFLRLAAVESGQIVNYARISREAGVSMPTVKSYYDLLEDMFVGFRVPAFSGSARKHVLSTPRFCFFDLGVRHAAADLAVARDTVLANPGPVFEQWVGIELWKRLQYRGRGSLSYLRTKAGAEVDWIVDDGKRLIPFEVKWSENPSPVDVRHLRAFLAEQRRASHGYVVCRCSRPRRIADNVTALPWWAL
ncbi:MAG: ATP-binding protein [Myxococcota bacterium]